MTVGEYLIFPLIVIYALVASICFRATYLERRGTRWDAYRIGGLSLCILWPTIAIVALISARGSASVETVTVLVAANRA